MTLHPDTPETQPQPSRERSLFLERAERFRHILIESIQAEVPLFLPLFGKSGDDLLIRAAYWEVLTQLCHQEGIEVSKLHITAQTSDDENEMNIFEAAVGIFSMGAAEKKIEANKGRGGTLYQNKLDQLAAVLGVQLDPEIYHRSPRIWPVDRGPLQEANPDSIHQKAEAIRAEIGDRQVVVIGQAGSLPEKRFSDEQLGEVARVIRQKYPTAVIIELSDKAFRSQPGERLPSQNPYVDRALTPTDINELLAYFQVADIAIMTDSYWMHLAASQDVPQLLALFTLYQPEGWAAPSTKVVRSEALAQESHEQISASLYHQRSQGTVGSGIAPQDIQRLEETIREL